MKYLLLLSVVIAAAAANAINDPVRAFKEGERFFYFPGDGDDTLHLVDTHEPVDEEFIRSYTRNPANTKYLLFTRANPKNAQEINLNNIDSLLNSNFDGSKQTKFVAHGWNGHGGNNMNRKLTEAFLQAGDFNVIVIDWGQLANRSYMTAKGGVAAVGRGVGQFIRRLASLGIPYDTLHLVGFSLGAHLVGNAGRETGGLVRRITGLDPAGPLWASDNERLGQNDAQYVEVIHTNTFFLGYTDPLGDADFYPNGGRSMPGCWSNSCSHSRAYEYMAASLKYNHFWANQCNSMSQSNWNNCNGPLFPMGNDDLDKLGSGIFRVNTASRYPF